MRYLLLIYNQEANLPQTSPGSSSPEDLEVALKPWWDYQDFLEEKGWYLAGDALQRTHTASTVRGREGNTITSDGPFAETKEQLGGFFMVKCDNLDEAIEAASRIPALDWGASIEVRPLQEFPSRPS
jgi:hypothetical protein